MHNREVCKQSKRSINDKRHPDAFCLQTEAAITAALLLISYSFVFQSFDPKVFGKFGMAALAANGTGTYGM
ncbi:hypothetical protein ACFFIX_27125 [Metabacillus herbersteinensis]|uniref:Uncharacterized protein n=1 Tax=Metabacillus herbersteinensis TaxID=283816 RepID=A0ABV6GMR7_9BACI